LAASVIESFAEIIHEIRVQLTTGMQAQLID
jgi:hypothetical protein